MKVLASHLTHFIQYAQIRGVATDELYAIITGGRNAFSEEHSTINIAEFYAVVRGITDALQDPLFGLRLGNFMNLKSLGLIYQISLKATTVEEALFYLKSYLHSTLPLIKLEMKVSSTASSIVISINNEEAELNRYLLEFVLTVISRELSIMSTDDLKLNISSPGYTSDYPHCWHRSECFNLNFSSAILKSNIRNTANLQLDILVPEYLMLIASLKEDNSFTARITIALLSMAKPALPDLNVIAEAFNMTPRTLQRRLSAEGTSFRAIAEQLKREISGLLIRHKRFTVSEISHVLGYSESASFIHSFRKLYGCTPEKARQGTVI